MTQRGLSSLVAPLYAEDFGLNSTQLTDREPGRVRTSAGGDVSVRGLDADHNLAGRLAAIGREVDRRVLGDRVDTLHRDVERYGWELELRAWLRAGAADPVRRRRPGLAVVLEVAARLDLEGLDVVVADVLLDPDADGLVVEVAAHRARHVRFDEGETRFRAWAGLVARLDAGAEAPWAVQAVPSLAHLGLAGSIPWLTATAAHGAVDVARAAAYGLLDLGAGSTRPKADIDAATLETSSRALLARWRREQDSDERSVARRDLRGPLLWALGSLATEATTAEVADAIRETIVRDDALEAAGALAAARGLLRGRARGGASRALGAALRRAPTDTADRFWGLLAQARG